MKRSRIQLCTVLALAMVTAFAICGCTAGGNAGKSGPVYMPSKITGYSDTAGGRETVTEYEYDSNGNLAKITQTTEHSTSSKNDIANVYTINYTDGVPSSFAETQSNSKNDVYVGEWTVSVEKDSAGRYTKIDKDGSGAEFTYGNDGAITAVTRYWSFGSPISYTIAADGYVETASSSPKKDSSGRVTSDEYTAALSGKKVVRAYTYDDKGNVISITQNSAKAYDIEYVEVPNASAATKAFANIKFNGDSIFWDVYSGGLR